MKPILSWVKGNMLVVVCVIVAVVAFPVLFVMGSGKSSALVDKVSSEVSSSERSLQQVSVQYSIPTLDPNEPPTEFSRVPNAATTRAALDAIEMIRSESEEVLDAATEFNSSSTTMLMDGLLPTPAGAELSMRQRFGALWVPSHQRLLQSIGAGSPPDAESVRLSVERELERLRDSKFGGRSGTELSPEESEEMIQAGRSTRLSIYRDQASRYSVYAAGDVFDGVVEPDPIYPPTIPAIWDMQHRYWVHETIMSAIARANTDARGLLERLPDVPVKRILRVVVDDWNLEHADDANPAMPLDALLTPDYESSVTGRSAWPSAPNSLYDIRYGEVVLHVSSDSVPDVLDAFNTTNLVTVVSCSLTQIDQQELLAEGYYYGGGHVVEMRVRLETLWLRTWTSETMPDEIKRALGVPVEGGEGQFDEFGQDQY
ncbi:MAG: hypothetical protein ACF8GE_07335 [Phycisphaerales bacterium JB043]